MQSRKLKTQLITTSSENLQSKFQPSSANRSKSLAFNSFSKLPKIASDQFFIQTAFPVHVTNTADFGSNPQTDAIIALLTTNNSLLTKIDTSILNLNSTLTKINDNILAQTSLLNSSLLSQIDLFKINNNLLTSIDNKTNPSSTAVLRKYLFLGDLPVTATKTPLTQIFTTLRYTNRNGVSNDNVVTILSRDGLTNSSGVLLKDVKVTISASLTCYIETTTKDSSIEILPILSSASQQSNSENFYVYKQIKNFNISEIPSANTYFIPTVAGNYPNKYTCTPHVFFQVELY